MRHHSIHTTELTNAELVASFNATVYSLAQLPGNAYLQSSLLRYEAEAARRCGDEYAAAVERRAAVMMDTDECTCLPLDGGLGAATCPACKDAAQDNEIEY
jgi:hypothetical protein